MELFGFRPCRDGCGKTVAYSSSERAVIGSLCPLNAEDRSRRTCNSRVGRLEAEFSKSLRIDDSWIDQVPLYLNEVNGHLKDHTLRIVREPKNGQQRLQ